MGGLWTRRSARAFDLPERVDPPPSEARPPGVVADSSRDERQSTIEEVAKLFLKSSKKHREAGLARVKARAIAPYFREWKQDALEDVRAVSGRPCDAVDWIRAVERARVKFDGLADSQDFDALDAELATAPTKALKHDDLTRRVTKAKEAAQLRGETAKGRHVLLSC